MDATEHQRDAMAKSDSPVILRPPAQADRDNRPINDRGPGIAVDNCGFHKPCVCMLVVNETLGYSDKCMSMVGNIDEWWWRGSR